VDIPDAILNRIVELIKQIWKRQAVLGMTAGVAYIHSLVEDLRLIRAKNDADAIFGESSDLVLLYSLMMFLVEGGTRLERFFRPYRSTIGK